MIRYLSCGIVCLHLGAAVAFAADPADVPSEQQARARLDALKQQVAATQREIRELEALLDESTEVEVKIVMVEVDAGQARSHGLPVLSNEGTTHIEPVPTGVASHDAASQVLAPERSTKIIETLVEQGHARIIATPAFITGSDEPASTLSGSEFPTLVPQRAGAVSIEWKDYGVRAKVTPRILENGRVRVAFDVWSGERDVSRQVKVQGMVIPGLRTRQVTASAEMDFDKTLVMCGMTSRESFKNADVQQPILNKVPYVSRLFTQVSHEEPPQPDTALIVLVTPRLVPRSNE